MKYMLMMAGPQQDWQQMATWSPDDIRAHIQFMQTFNEKLVESGEFVEAQGLAGPETAKVVRARPDGTPDVTDGPFPETKEFLAGYWIVDVDDEQRALELAGQISAAPGQSGSVARVPVEVRPIGEPPNVDS